MATVKNRETALSSEEELVESLTGACMLATFIKQPNARKAAREGLVDLCGLVIALRRRVERLEDRIPEYKGVWSNGKYMPGSMVTHDGSLFYCKAETTDKPGAGGDWQLCVKRGRDGKDATK